MRASDLRTIIKTEPFEPVSIGLSDGRSVIVRHPDQVVISDRYLYVGLAKIKRSRPLATPKSGEEIAKDFLWVNLLQVATVEPLDHNGRKKTPRKRKS